MAVFYRHLLRMHMDCSANFPVKVDDTLFFMTKEILFVQLNIQEDRVNSNLLLALLEYESSFEEFFDVFGRAETTFDAA